MLHVNKIICLAGLLFLASCGHLRENQTTVTVPQTIIARPATPVLSAPTVIVVNRQNLSDFVELINSGEIVIALTQEQFELLLENQQQILVFIANQNSVLNQYESRIINHTE
jgi:hypothetical protein